MSIKGYLGEIARRRVVVIICLGAMRFGNGGVLCTTSTLPCSLEARGPYRLAFLECAVKASAGSGKKSLPRCGWRRRERRRRVRVRGPVSLAARVAQR